MEDVKGMWYTINEGYRSWGALKSVLSNRRQDKGQEVSIGRSDCTYDVVWSRGMGYEECCEKESVCSEMKCLRSLVGVSRMDRVANEEVRRRVGIEGS